MSRLAVGSDDHPEAAEKHLEDATILSSTDRHDGAAYLAGYVLECVLKSVILHDRSYDPNTGATDAVALRLWHQTLRRHPFGHNLTELLLAALGPAGAPYAPPIELASSLVDSWSESMRYHRAGECPPAQAQAFVEWARVAILSVIRMRIDGVL